MQTFDRSRHRVLAWSALGLGLTACASPELSRGRELGRDALLEVAPPDARLVVGLDGELLSRSAVVEAFVALGVPVDALLADLRDEFGLEGQGLEGTRVACGADGCVGAAEGSFERVDWEAISRRIPRAELGRRGPRAEGIAPEAQVDALRAQTPAGEALAVWRLSERRVVFGDEAALVAARAREEAHEGGQGSETDWSWTEGVVPEGAVFVAARDPEWLVDELTVRLEDRGEVGSTKALAEAFAARPALSDHLLAVGLGGDVVGDQVVVRIRARADSAGAAASGATALRAALAGAAGRLDLEHEREVVRDGDLVEATVKIPVAVLTARMTASGGSR